jgi:hypothetical protein
MINQEDIDMNGVDLSKASHITTHDIHAASNITSPHCQTQSTSNDDDNTVDTDMITSDMQHHTNTSSSGSKQENGSKQEQDDDDDIDTAAVAEDVEEDELLQLTPQYTSMKRTLSNESSLEPIQLLGDTALDRLDYLLQQTEQFAALVKPKKTPDTPSQHGRNRESIVCLLSYLLQLEYCMIPTTFAFAVGLTIETHVFVLCMHVRILVYVG